MKICKFCNGEVKRYPDAAFGTWYWKCIRCGAKALKLRLIKEKAS